MKCLANTKSVGKMISERTDQNLRNGIRFYTAAVALVLLDKQGFTPEQTKDALSCIQELFDGINQGYCDFDDIIDTLNEDYGLDLRLKFI